MIPNIRSALPLAALCLILFSGCVPAPAETPSPTPAHAPLEPPLTGADLALPVPDFLDEGQQDLYRRAFSAANFLMGCSTAAVDKYPLADGSAPGNTAWDTTVLEEGRTYLISCGRYRRWEDFQAMMDGLFTPRYQEELLSEAFLDGTVCPKFTSTEDGLLCYLDLDRGSDLEYGWSGTPDSFVLVEQTGERIDFNLVGHYAILDYGDTEDAMPTAVGEYTREYPIRLEKTDLGWRVAEIHLPY